MKKGTVNPIKQKKALINVLERIYDYADGMKTDKLQDYRVVGKESVQAKHWKTGELLWEDEEKTIPKYKDIYDYVPISEEELTEEGLAELNAIDEILKHLEKLI